MLSSLPARAITALFGSWSNSGGIKSASTGPGDEVREHSKKPERIFSISGNSKGLRCPFKPIVCLEGYCRECQIYLDWQKLRGKREV